MERFAHEIWKDLLVTVHSVVGPHFQSPVMARFNSEAPTSISSQPGSAMIGAIRMAVCRAPDVVDNPALREAHALDALMAEISPAVLKWAAQKCQVSLKNQSRGSAPAWPQSVVERVKADETKFRRMLTHLHGTGFSEPSAGALHGRYDHRCERHPGAGRRRQSA